MLSLLAWTAGGGKWRIYIAIAAVASATLFLAYLRWRAIVRRSLKRELAAEASARKLARALEGIKVDDEIRSLSFDERRERLRLWTATD